MLSSVERSLNERREAALQAGDVAIAAVIFCFAVLLGAYAVRAHRAAGGSQYFYQAEFGPAVMEACGRGLLNPDTEHTPPLAAFLSERTDALDCGELPADIAVTSLDSFQRVSRYLELTVALTWRMTGVSWSRLAILSGILFGAVAALDYALLRLALSRTFALLSLVPTLISTNNFMLAPHIRDYAKGPFLLAVILVMGLLVTGSSDRRRAIALSALAGAVVGLGLGFRADLFVAVPPFLFTVAFLLPREVSSRIRVAAIAVFLGALAVIASPVLRDYSQGSNTGHVILLGLTPPFDQPLRIQPSVYEFASDYNDSLAFSIINSYAVRVENRREGVAGGTVEYETAAMKYLGDIAARFPADLVTRTLASIRAVPRFFLDYLLYPPQWVRSQVGYVFYRIRARIWFRLAPLAVPAVAAATIVISAANPRAAWLIVVIMIGFAGASAVQFNERHFYYLELVPWWAFGLIAQTAIRAPFWWGTVTAVQVKRAAVVCALVFAATGGAVALSRGYQQKAAARLFESYETAPHTPLPLVQREAGAGRTLMATDEWLRPLPPDLPRVLTRFLAVQFRDDLCGPGNLPLTIRYQATLAELDFSEPKTVQLRSAPTVPTTLFVAAYDRGNESVRFRGIEVATEHARCVGQLSRVEGLDRAPLLLTTILAGDWRDERLYQRLR